MKETWFTSTVEEKPMLVEQKVASSTQTCYFLSYWVQVLESLSSTSTVQFKFTGL